MDFQNSDTTFLTSMAEYGWTDSGNNIWSYRVVPNLNVGVLLQRSSGFNLGALIGMRELHLGLETRFLEQRITIRLGYSGYGFGSSNPFIQQNFLTISFGYIIKGNIMMMIEDNTEAAFGESATLTERLRDSLKKYFGQDFGINYTMTVDITGSGNAGRLGTRIYRTR